MSEIQPVRSLRRELEAGEANRRKAARLLEMARKLMERAVAQDLPVALVQQAVELYAQVTELDPEQPEAWLALAYISQQCGDPVMAGHWLTTLLRHQPASLKGQHFHAEITQTVQALEQSRRAAAALERTHIQH